MKKCLVFMIGLFLLVGITTNVHAGLLNLLNPGDSQNVSNEAVPAGILLDSQDVLFSNDYFSGISYQEVYKNDTGMLFVYSFENSINSLNSITRMTATDFAGWNTWADASLVADTTYSIDRSFSVNGTSGDSIGFGFKNGDPQQSNFDPGVQPGNLSSIMWIQTNAPAYTIGGLSFIDGRTSDILAYGPAACPVPEPMSLSLLGFGLFGLIGLRKKKN
ncbi:MAG: PEP-CTERM sorting domain-containing protein [Candidatus Omnitrophota bacterium]